MSAHSLNGLEDKLGRVMETLADYTTVVQGVQERLHDFRHIDSLPIIAEGVRQLNRTLIVTHIIMIGALSIFIIVLLLKDSNKDLSITPSGIQFQGTR